MRNKKPNRVRLAAAILLFALCMAAAHALAANATTVYVNNHELDGTAGKTYWRNWNQPADSSNWNAYFDTSTAVPTLRLRGATIYIAYTIPPHNDSHALIYGNGDFNLSFSGSNSLSFNGSVNEEIVGVQSYGNLVITEAAGETGSVTINLTNWGDDKISMGIGANETLTVESGTIDITANAKSSAHALGCREFWLNGGQITANSISEGLAEGINTDDFHITDGTIAVTLSSPSDEVALTFSNAEFTGGEGRFESGGIMCVLWEDADIGDFIVSGGHVVFSCTRDSALWFASESISAPNATVPILVSTDGGGAGKTLWNSSMGQLATNISGSSSYRYVEFGGVPDPKKPEASPPQTGDAQTPLLWLGIGLITLSGVGALLCVRRKRRA